MSCLAGKIFHSHNKILLSRDENNLLIDHSKFLKIFCDLYMYCSGSFGDLSKFKYQSISILVMQFQIPEHKYFTP